MTVTSTIAPVSSHEASHHCTDAIHLDPAGDVRLRFGGGAAPRSSFCSTSPGPWTTWTLPPRTSLPAAAR
jgi:hypothetical protein